VTNTLRGDLDRATSGRFVRNLALSLSGGALLTLIGATAAHADDSATASDGAGTARSGDATAVGNKSGSTTTQTGTPSGSGGTLQVINQTGVVANAGVAVANTGGNTAVGNSSSNTATATQGGIGGLGPATNSGTAANSSNGNAAISTGNASAVGNESTTTLSQSATGNGALGGIVLISQGGAVLNSGVALADTGNNTATGNDSDNEATLDQIANAAAGLAANSGRASNGSDGKATISTGDAKAVGNHSETTLVQSANGAAGGDTPGLVVIGQGALVANVGLAAATTGTNVATGNLSENDATTTQTIGDTNPVITGLASNSGEATSSSGGSAGIATGAATATGNTSTTGLHQATEIDVTDGGNVALPIQAASVLNAGLATADTGNNTATGNESDNDATTTSDIDGVGVAPYLGVASNSGTAGNTSDGTATIATGPAWASGNESTTELSQHSEAAGGDLHLLPQVAGVQNLGAATADSGGNVAGGNNATNLVDVTQDTTWSPDSPTAASVQSNQAEGRNQSNGSGHVTTGAAWAKGNRSDTVLTQDLDPTGLILPVQAADVVNAGLATANTGGNFAGGNGSDNTADLDQDVAVGEGSASPVSITAPLLVGSSSGHAGNSSDGTASVTTGAATATGNDSHTDVAQTSTGSIDGMGIIVNPQAALVANVGVGAADSGGNTAIGNLSQNDATAVQSAALGAGNTVAPTTSAAGIATVSNSAEVDTTTDGAASIRTGAATANGNASSTHLAQDEGGEISGMGTILNPQLGVVVNAGAGIANSGANTAIGNGSNNRTDAVQDALVGSGNLTGTTTVVAGQLLAANQGDVDTTSRGSADIATGAATANGNRSTTELTQHNGGEIDGMGLEVNTEVGVVANLGLGVANSGANLALGNVSNNDQDGPLVVNLDQDANVGSLNDGPPSTTIAGLTVGASNAGSASTSSDGAASVRSGAATANGNVSETDLSQDPDSSIDGMGTVLGTQVAGVANVGIGVANSGLNGAVGNASGQVDILAGPDSNAELSQLAEVGSSNTSADPVSIAAAGPLMATNSADVSNASDGTAKVGTGAATATGNTSSTHLTQDGSGNVSEMGLVVGTQVAGVANVGVGVANSGLNLAVGNASSNAAAGTQASEVVSGVATPIDPVIALGPVVAGNSATVGNASDGEACVCTGDATASGNISQTTLDQDLDLSTTNGTVVATEAGGVLNAGLGVANSGLNLGIGNISNNTATLTQTTTIDDALLGLPVVGPQVANNGGGATNTSAGTGKVGTGKATAIGNDSETTFAQAAAVDSTLALPTLVGGTANVGAGIANAGLNLGVGNASTNTATLTQTADGGGIVSNQGEATNQSDGTAIIGDPNCEVPGSPTPDVPGLPKTGGPIEVEAAVALMLLLLGFGIRRTAQRLD
jgi:hypothetical protein